jgi:hypothetical protein
MAKKLKFRPIAGQILWGIITLVFIIVFLWQCKASGHKAVGVGLVVIYASIEFLQCGTLPLLIAQGIDLKKQVIALRKHVGDPHAASEEATMAEAEQELACVGLMFFIRILTMRLVLIIAVGYFVFG